MVLDPSEKTQAKVAAAIEAVHEPIVISANTLPTMLASIGRILAILATGIAVLLKFMEARDVVGLWTWMQTTDGAAFVATVGLVISFGSSMYLTWKKHKKIIVLAATAPDSVGQIK